MTRFPVRFAAFLLGLFVAAAAFAQDAAHYTQRSPSGDGIGKVYMGREIARVMSWHGADWLERAERAGEERPDLLLSELRLTPGMTVVDVGAGTGYYSWRMAKQVGGSGVVYAVDIQPEMLELLERQVKHRGVRNVKPVLGTATDPRLAGASLDLALLVDVYHELEYPHEMLAAIVRALKPGGRVVFVEYKAEDPAVPIKPLHKMSEAQVRKEAAVHPLQWVRTVRTLPWQHVVIYRKIE